MARTLSAYIFWGILCSGLASAAFAQATQAELAQRIETLSVTGALPSGDTSETTFFSPLEWRRSIEVDGCDFMITSAATQNGAVYSDISVTFDVSRAVFPAQDEQNGGIFAFIPASENGLIPTASAIFAIVFREPYQPIIYITKDGIKTDHPIKHTAFVMDPVEDERHVRDLLAAIDEYKKTYCFLSG